MAELMQVRHAARTLGLSENTSAAGSNEVSCVPEVAERRKRLSPRRTLRLPASGCTRVFRRCASPTTSFRSRQGRSTDRRASRRPPPVASAFADTWPTALTGQQTTSTGFPAGRACPFPASTIAVRRGSSPSAPAVVTNRTLIVAERRRPGASAPCRTSRPPSDRSDRSGSHLMDDAVKAVVRQRVADEQHVPRQQHRLDDPSKRDALAFEAQVVVGDSTIDAGRLAQPCSFNSHGRASARASQGRTQGSAPTADHADSNSVS